MKNRTEPRLNCGEARRRWLEQHGEILDNGAILAEAKPGLFYRCPCCGFRTLGTRGGFEICAVCFWEDDGQDDHDADRVRGGPNGSLSLTAARQNYDDIGACEPSALQQVRGPKEGER